MVDVGKCSTINHDLLSYLGIKVRLKDFSIFHIGILFSDISQPVKCLHLAWHHRLQCDDPFENGYWFRSKLSDRNRKQMAARCFLLSYNSDTMRIAYNIRYPTQSTYFDEFGDYLGPVEGEGLTCATFVLAVFRDYGFPLVKEDEWPVREDDILFHNEIISTLRRTRASEAHIRAVEKDVGCARFRPGEVAGAALSHTPPADFKEASELNDKITNGIRDLSDHN